MNVPISQPTLPDLRKVIPHLKKIWKSRIITNGTYVQRFENTVKEHLDVEEVIGVSCATSGLILAVQALGLTGEVLVPSFTFPASAHALVWNGITPVFIECDRTTFNLDLDDLERKITPKTTGIMGVHVFGNPIDMQRLTAIARKHRLKIIIDGAHALGSQYRRQSVGAYGDVTVFSLAPTKLVTSGEGGLIVTRDTRLAKELRLARNYGNPPDYNCQCIGLNARLTELHAVVGIESFKHLNRHIRIRNKLVGLYKKRLQGIGGLTFQHVSEDDVSTYNYCGIYVDETKTGIHCKALHERLLGHGIHSKRYFYPAVHQQDAYQKYRPHEGLCTTDEVSHRVLCPPLFSHMKKDTLLKICDIIKKIIHASGKKGYKQGKVL